MYLQTAYRRTQNKKDGFKSVLFVFVRFPGYSITSIRPLGYFTA